MAGLRKPSAKRNSLSRGRGISDGRKDTEGSRRKRSRAALVESIASALVIKDEDVFFLCAENGELPLQGRHGYGLYYHDCRFLDGYELRLAGSPLSRLISSAGAGF